MECRVAPLREFPPADRESCSVALCRPGSEMQQEWLDGTSTTPVAVIYDGIHPVAWAASHVWRMMPTLEGFTRESFRRRGLQRFAACGLIAARVLDPDETVAVFSPACVELTRSLGFSSVLLFLRRNGDWVFESEVADA